MQANIKVEGNFKLGHVEVIGNGLPFILKLDKGYARAFCHKSEDGFIAVIGSSNTEAKQTKKGFYKMKEGEEITPVIGVVMDTIENARMFKRLFDHIFKIMKEEQEKREHDKG